MEATEQERTKLILLMVLAWAWVTNGCCSVFGIFAGRIAGLFWGFDRALLIGLALYVFTAACAIAHVRDRTRMVRPWIAA